MFCLVCFTWFFDGASYPGASRHPFEKGMAAAPHVANMIQALLQPMQTKARNRCRQRSATATSPFQRGRGYAKALPAMPQAIPLSDDGKGPQPRPPPSKGAGGMQKPCPPCYKPCRNRCRQRPATATSPFQRGRGYAKVMPTLLQPMQTKTRSRDLPSSEGSGVCIKTNLSKNSFFIFPGGSPSIGEHPSFC